jgi:RNA polymerase sigma-70 factor (ECF subfamily)
LDAWAFRITRNAIADYYRASEHRAAPGKTLNELAADSMDGEPPTDPHTEMAYCIAPMVRQLPQNYRQALELTELEGMTQTAAAEQLGLSVPGMKSRVQRGRARLRAMLLRCCEIETDHRGQVLDFKRRGGEGSAACGDQRRDLYSPNCR